MERTPSAMGVGKPAPRRIESTSTVRIGCSRRTLSGSWARATKRFLLWAEWWLDETRFIFLWASATYSIRGIRDVLYTTDSRICSRYSRILSRMAALTQSLAAKGLRARLAGRVWRKCLCHNNLRPLLKNMARHMLLAKDMPNDRIIVKGFVKISWHKNFQIFLETSRTHGIMSI